MAWEGTHEIEEAHQAEKNCDHIEEGSA